MNIDTFLTASVKKTIIKKVENEVFKPFSELLKRIENDTEKGVLLINRAQNNDLYASLVIVEKNNIKSVLFSTSIKALLNDNEMIIQNANEKINQYLVENNIE